MPLSESRNTLDRIDREIIRLVQVRQTCVVKIGETKKAAGAQIFVPDREEALLEKLENIAPEILPKNAVRSIFREIISLSVGTQLDLPVAYLGPEGTYTHQAAQRNFGSGVALKALRTIPDVFAAVEHDEAAYGVVPVENSTEGAIAHSLDMLAESDLKIVAQIYLGIEHCLIGRGPIAGIKKILSKDIALAQCRDWLRRNLPDAELVAADSTAAAVLAAAEDAGNAAVASAVAAGLYDVPVLAAGIQDMSDNITRFLVVGKKPNPPSKTCEDKTSLVLSLKHEPGTLQRALQPVSAHGLNLTRIESRPNRRKAWEYLFFIDILGHWENPKIQTVVEELKSSCESVKWLGSYPNIQNKA